MLTRDNSIAGCIYTFYMPIQMALLFIICSQCWCWVADDGYGNESLNAGYICKSQFVPGEILIKLKPGRYMLSDEDRLYIDGCDVSEIIWHDEIKLIKPIAPRQLADKVPPLRDVLKMVAPKLSKAQLLECCDILSSNPGVKYAAPNKIYYFDFTPDDPLFKEQYSLRNTGQGGGITGADIDALRAWDLQQGAGDVIVGVIDTGIDLDHPDLWQKIWVNRFEVAFNGIDDDNNGFIDDIVGWDFANEDPYPVDDFGHGTHVAGIIGAVGNNGEGIAGVDFNCRLMAVKIGSIYGLHEDDAALGLAYAAAMGAKILNNSWGGYIPSELINQVIQYVEHLGCLVVAAAGNDDTDWPHYPGYLEQVLCVASVDSRQQRSIWRLPFASSYGDWVDINAFGSEIISCFPDNGYAKKSGTSMATPMVSGVAALTLASYPNLPARQLKARLIATADNIDTYDPDFANKLGAGRVNAYRAISERPHPMLIIGQVDCHDHKGNQDGRLEPSEKAAIRLSLQNVWVDSPACTATIHTDNRFVKVTKRGVNLAPLSQDNLVEMQDFFEIELSAICPIDQRVQFDVNFSYQGDYPMTRDHFFLTLFSPIMPERGFPFTIAENITTDPCFADLDGDEELEIIFGTGQGRLYALDHHGEPVHGFPIKPCNGILANPAAADIDNDSNIEIVVSTVSQGVMVIDHKGNLLPNWPASSGGHGSPSAPALADIDGDGCLDIIDTAWDGVINAWDHKARPLPGFPIRLENSGGMNTSPGVGDLDGDGLMDIIVPTKSGSLHVIDAYGRQLNGFPLDLGIGLTSAPAAGDMDKDGDLEIVLGGQDGKLYIINHDGSFMHPYPVETLGSFTSSPALGDLDADGMLDVVIGSEDGFLYAFNWRGEALDGFPVNFKQGIVSSPLIADVNGNGFLEVIITIGNHLFILDCTGKSIAGSPLNLHQPSTATPAIADMDGDGRLEIGITVNNRKLSLFDLFSLPRAKQVPWGAYHKDNLRCGFIDDGRSQRPKILMGGALVESTDQKKGEVKVRLIALVRDADNDVNVVKVYFKGELIAEMNKEKAIPDQHNHDLWFSEQVTLDDESILTYHPEMIARDEKGNRSHCYPYLTITPWDKPDSYNDDTASSWEANYLNTQAGTILAPRIIIAGFWDAGFTTLSSGYLRIYALVLFGDEVTGGEVELFCLGLPTGIKLERIASLPIEGAELQFYEYKAYITPQMVAKGSYQFMLIASDESGSRSAPWPYIQR